MLPLYAAFALLAMKASLLGGASDPCSSSSTPDLVGGSPSEAAAAAEEEGPPDQACVRGFADASTAGLSEEACLGLQSWAWGTDPCGYPTWEGVGCEVRLELS